MCTSLVKKLNVINSKLLHLDKISHLKSIYRRLSLNSHRCLSHDLITNRDNNSSVDSCHLIDTSSEEIGEILLTDMKVYENFITEKEEQDLLNEAELHLKRLPYECNHWDDAIQGYREVQRKNWKESNKRVFERVKEVSFKDRSVVLPQMHVLDIEKTGYIKPHIDSVRFCGDTVAGLSLLSSSVMRLVMDSAHDQFADILLSRRSLYVMTNRARYQFTHEILEDSKSFFRGHVIPRERRISIILRNEPS